MNKPSSVDLTPGKQLAIAGKPTAVKGGWTFRLIIPGQLQIGTITIFESVLSIATGCMMVAMEARGYFVIFSSRSN